MAEITLGFRLYLDVAIEENHKRIEMKR